MNPMLVVEESNGDISGVGMYSDDYAVNWVEIDKQKWFDIVGPQQSEVSQVMDDDERTNTEKRWNHVMDDDERTNNEKRWNHALRALGNLSRKLVKQNQEPGIVGPQQSEVK